MTFAKAFEKVAGKPVRRLAMHKGKLIAKIQGLTNSEAAAYSKAKKHMKAQPGWREGIEDAAKSKGIPRHLNALVGNRLLSGKRYSSKNPKPR